jgi:hypothetical protein
VKLKLLGAAFAAVMTCAPASAVVLTFEDLPALAATGQPVPDGYGAIDWTNLFYLNTSFQPSNGYRNGTTSGTHVGYSVAGFDVLGTSTIEFSLARANFTAAFNDGMLIIAQGFRTGSLLPTHSTSFTVNTAGPTPQTFNWNGLNAILFTSVGGVANPNVNSTGKQFVIDDIDVSAVPEPATWAMMLIGFGAVGFSMRSARRQQRLEACRP